MLLDRKYDPSDGTYCLPLATRSGMTSMTSLNMLDCLTMEPINEDEAQARYGKTWAWEKDAHS